VCVCACVRVCVCACVRACARARPHLTDQTDAGMLCLLLLRAVGGMAAWTNMDAHGRSTSSPYGQATARPVAQAGPAAQQRAPLARHTTPLAMLKQYWGYDTFRGPQVRAVVDTHAHTHAHTRTHTLESYTPRLASDETVVKSTALPAQAAVVEAALAGEDNLLVMATGAGKSLCMQVTGRCRLMPLCLGATFVIARAGAGKSLCMQVRVACALGLGRAGWKLGRSGWKLGLGGSWEDMAAAW
jgi:superfamily II DNA helicase RecQ